MAFSASNVSAGQDALAAQYNNLLADLKGAHHQWSGGTKIANADVADAAAIAMSKLILAITDSECASGLHLLTEAAQTISGVKTFDSIPVLPASDPTTDNQAARKKYVDDNQLTYIELAGSWHTPGHLLSWHDWDLSGSIPTGGKYAEILVKIKDKDGGIRKNGSALNRMILGTTAGAYAEYCVNMTVELDADRIVEIHSGYGSEIMSADLMYALNNEN